MKRCKRLLLKVKINQEFKVAMAQLNNTERVDGRSPSSIFHHGVVWSQLPSLRLPFDLAKAKKAREKAAVQMRQSATGVKPRKEFQRGDQVVIKDPKTKRWMGQGRVVKAPRLGHRSYVIETGSGLKLWSGKILRPVPGPDSVRSLGGLNDHGSRSCLKGGRAASLGSDSDSNPDGPPYSHQSPTAGGQPKPGIQFSPEARLTRFSLTVLCGEGFEELVVPTSFMASKKCVKKKTKDGEQNIDRH